MTSAERNSIPLQIGSGKNACILKTIYRNPGSSVFACAPEAEVVLGSETGVQKIFKMICVTDPGCGCNSEGWIKGTGHKICSLVTITCRTIKLNDFRVRIKF